MNAEVKKFRNKFLVTCIFELPILILLWVIPYHSPKFLTSFEIIGGNTLYLFVLLFLSGVIQFGCGSDFYKGAFKSVKHGSANMDVLVVLGTTAAWLYGLILMIMGHDLTMDMEMEDPHNMIMMPIHGNAHNFEIASTLITIILLGKLLEATSKK